MGLKQLLGGQQPSRSSYERDFSHVARKALQSPLAAMPDVLAMKSMESLLAAGARAGVSRLHVSPSDISHRSLWIFNRGSLSMPEMGFSAQGLTVIRIKETKITGRGFDSEW